MKDIIIFGGQSNMQGQAEKLLRGTPVSDAYEYLYLSDSYVPLKDPCGEDIRADGSLGYRYSKEVSGTWHADNVLGSACCGYSTLVPAFCEAYLKKADELGVRIPLIAVHAAKGSTDINYWQPMTDGYRLLCNKAKKAINGAGEARRRYFVWLQGESDALASRTCGEYKTKLSLLGHSLEKDLGIDRIGIIRVGRFTMDERDLEIIKAQDEICNEDPMFVMLTTAAAEYSADKAHSSMMNPTVHGHFSAAGLESLGYSAGASLAQLLR